MKPSADTPAPATVINTPNNQLALGVSLNLCAFFCFAVMDTSAKWLVTAGIAAIQVTFLRYLFHFMWVLVLYLPRQGLAIFRSNHIGLQGLRAVALLTSTFFNFYALKYLPLTITIAIFFAAPLVVCLLSIPVLGEKVGLRRLAAVIVGFMGVLIIVAPWNAQISWHVVFSICAMLCASTYFVLTRKIAGIDSNAVAQAYAAGISTIVLAPLAFVFGGGWDISTANWAIAFLLGSLGMLGHSLLTNAHRYVEASVLAPSVYSQILYITLFSWLFFDSTPSVQTIIGTAIIVASGIYLWRRETRHS